MRRSLIMLVALAAVLAAALPALADSGGGATARLSGSPNPVTAGTTVAYTTTFRNGTSLALQNTTLSAPAPAGFSITSVSASGSCTTSSGGATCTFGTLAKGATASATIIMNVPAATGNVASSVTWTTSDGDHDSDDITLTVSTRVTVKAPSTDSVSEYVPPSGGTVSTNQSTSASNPQATAVDVPETPDGVPVSLSEVNASSPQDACGPGATCVGQISVVTIPGTFSVTDPLHLRFILDSTELKHLQRKQLLKLPMYHDGVLVSNCTGAPGVASPDPCVSARKIIRVKPGHFRLEIDVNSSTNGRWRP
jgi:uncharacterized repeat protein (TIGR01451 family)